MFHHELKAFGTILKTHGIHGDFIVSVVSDVPEKFHLPHTVFIVVEGIPVPFFVEYYEVISNNSLKIKFDTISNRDDAMHYYNHTLMAAKTFVASCFPEQNILLLTGYTVLDENNKKIGIITEFSDIPGNPVVTVDTGKDLIMLPISDELIIGIDEKTKKITVTIPKGLV